MADGVNIAAIQFKCSVDDYKNAVTFKNRIETKIEEALKKADASCPTLTVFPEHIGTPMILFNSYNAVHEKPSFSQAVSYLVNSNLSSVLSFKVKYGISFIRALLLSSTKSMEREYRTVFSGCAKKYGVYIAAGSIALGDIDTNGIPRVSGANVYNVSYLFGPDGAVLGKQKKVHLVDFEGKNGFDLSGGKIDELNVFDTPIGSLGIAICLDGFREDVIDRLNTLGADILVQPSANNGLWTEWQQEDWLNGAYLAVHEKKKFKYAVNSMMTGNMFDLSFEGQSAIISGSETNRLMNYGRLEPAEGFVEIAEGYDDEEVMVSTVEV